MKLKLLSVFLLLFTSLNAFALQGVVNPGVIPNIQVGGRTFTDLSNLIILFAAPNSTSQRATFRRMGASSGYTPSGSKSFRVLAVSCTSTVASQSCSGTMAQTDNDVGNGSTTAFTNPVYATTASSLILPPSSSPGVGSNGQFPVDFTIANGKYLSWDTTNSAIFDSILVFGYEQ